MLAPPRSRATLLVTGPAALVIVVAWSACGGTAFTSGGSGSGTGGAPATSAATGEHGATTSSSSGGGNGGAGSDVSASSAGGSGGAMASSSTGVVSGCPDNPPSPGSSCDPEGNPNCPYTGQYPCCSAAYTCPKGSWMLACSSPSCPLNPPQQGDACGCDQQACSYPGQCPDTAPLDATCTGGHWVITPGPACPVQCGNVACGAGQFCLTKDSGGPLTQLCVDNVCNGAPTCECLTMGTCAGLKCEQTGPDQFSCSP